MTQLAATLRFTVTADDTALAVGSGSLSVLGTPRLVAWCVAATCAAIAPVLERGSTSVGTRVELHHLSASPVGVEVEVTPEVTSTAGRQHRFAVVARHVDEAMVIASGEVTRVVVDAERFMAKLPGR